MKTLDKRAAKIDELNWDVLNKCFAYARAWFFIESNREDKESEYEFGIQCAQKGHRAKEILGEDYEISGYRLTNISCISNPDCFEIAIFNEAMKKTINNLWKLKYVDIFEDFLSNELVTIVLEDKETEK